MIFEGPVSGLPDAIIRQIDVPPRLTGGARIGPCVEASDGAYLLNMPRVARILAHDGNTIDVQPATGGEAALVSILLDTSARAALIQQRGELALEATTLVAPGGACVALCGHSGLGKSTIAAALSGRGWLLLADGVTRASWDGTRTLAWPSHSVLKLWRNACEMLAIDVEGLPRVRSSIEKFFVPVPAASEPASLSAIVWLSPEPEIRLTAVPADETLGLLSDCTYRVGQIAAMGREEQCTKTATGIAGACRLWRLEGARRAGLSELAYAVEEATR